MCDCDFTAISRCMHWIRWLGEGVFVMLCDVAFVVIVIGPMGVDESNAKWAAQEFRKLAAVCA